MDLIFLFSLLHRLPHVPHLTLTARSKPKQKTQVDKEFKDFYLRPNKASVAVLLRVVPKQTHINEEESESERTCNSQCIGNQHSTKCLNSFLDKKWVKEGKVEILYLKRAIKKGDPWSGHVAYPGGHYEPGDTSAKHTAERETYEEVGLQIDNSDWACVGRLDDRLARDKLVNIYVFFQMLKTTPPMRLQVEEVAAVRWIPISFFLENTNNQILQDLEHPFTVGPKFIRKNILRLEKLILASTKLPKNLPAPEMDETSLKTTETIPKNDTEELEFILWGLTFDITSELFEKTVRRNPLNWPAVRVENVVINVLLQYSHQLIKKWNRASAKTSLVKGIDEFPAIIILASVIGLLAMLLLMILLCYIFLL